MPAHVLFPQFVAICERYVASEGPQARRPQGRVPAPLLRLGDRAARRGDPAGHVARARRPRSRSTRKAAARAPRPTSTSGPPGRPRGPQIPPQLRRRRHAPLGAVSRLLHRHQRRVAAFVKNPGLGFAIPYLHNGQAHDYVPDFIVRLKTDPPIHLILETKGFDPLEDVKRAAAERWVAAVNADGSYGRWRYALAKKTTEVNKIVEAACPVGPAVWAEEHAISRQ